MRLVGSATMHSDSEGRVLKRFNYRPAGFFLDGVNMCCTVCYFLAFVSG